MKKLSIYTSATATFLASASFAFADNGICPKDVGGNSGSTFNFLCNASFSAIIGSLITFMFVLSGIIALFFLVWGGIKWVTSQGEKAGVEGARNQIMAALIGLILIFLSYAIVNIALQFFTGTTLSNLRIPTIGG